MFLIFSPFFIRTAFLLSLLSYSACYLTVLLGNNVSPGPVQGVFCPVGTIPKSEASALQGSPSGLTALLPLLFSLDCLQTGFIFVNRENTNKGIGTNIHWKAVNALSSASLKTTFLNAFTTSKGQLCFWMVNRFCGLVSPQLTSSKPSLQIFFLFSF